MRFCRRLMVRPGSNSGFFVGAHNNFILSSKHNLNRMKRQFNIFDGLFLLTFFAKALHLTMFGHGVTWFAVFVPYLVEGLLVIAREVLTRLSVPEKLRFWLWKLWLRMATRKIKAEAMRNVKQSANPGTFNNPADFGKS